MGERALPANASKPTMFYCQYQQWCRVIPPAGVQTLALLPAGIRAGLQGMIRRAGLLIPKFDANIELLSSWFNRLDLSATKVAEFATSKVARRSDGRGRHHYKWKMRGDAC